MSGHVRQRGKRWYAIINVVKDSKRKRVWHRLDATVTNKKEAKVACAKLIGKQADGAYIEPSRMTVAEFVRSRINQWEAASEITARTAERYRELTRNQIAPHTSTKFVQKLTRLDIEGWHTSLRTTGISARTIGHAHRL